MKKESNNDGTVMTAENLDDAINAGRIDTTAQDFTTLDDFFSAVRRPQEIATIGGRTLYFEGLSAENKDRLIATHSKDDGMGNVSVENKQWRTNVIAGAWVRGFGGARVLDKPEDVKRFYSTVPAQTELQMYEVAARVSGLGEVDKRRKNSSDDGGTATSRT